VSSLDEIRPGQGAIIRLGMTKVAAYRDESGRIHARSAACTHLGCHLHWNSFECCWDCPCLRKAAKTVRKMQWFQILETRGHITDGNVSHWQVSLKVGFTLDD